MAEDVIPSTEEIIEERIYIVPFFPFLKRHISRNKRVPRAIRLLRDFIKRHMKVENVVIDPEVNHAIRSRGIKKPPRKIKVRVVKTEEKIAEVFLA